MTPVFPILPRSFIALVLPGRLLVLRYGLSPFGASKLKERREYPIEGHDGLLKAFEAVRQDYKPSADDTWRLGLPLRTFTAVNFRLPEAAARNLDQAVHYALMSHLPFEPSDAYTNFVATREDGKVDISAVAALRGHLQPYLEAVSSAGFTLTAVTPSLAMAAHLHGTNGVYIQADEEELELLVFKDQRIIFQTFETLPPSENEEASDKAFWKLRLLMENSLGAMDGPFYLFESRRSPEEIAQGMRVPPESVRTLVESKEMAAARVRNFPYEIDLVPPAVLRRRRVAFWIQAAALVVLLLTLTALPASKLLGKRERLKELETRIAEAKKQAKELTEIRAANEELARNLREINDYVHAQPEISDILKEITELLPDDAWVSSFTFAKNQVVLQGQAASATAVLEVLEHSPFFKEVRFDSQITRQGESEVYKIIARLE